MSDEIVLTEEEGRQRMDERARLLARPTETTDLGRNLELLMVTTATERFAFETKYVRGILPLPDITPVPDLPLFFRGVMNNAGGVVPVLDLAALMSGGNASAANGDERVIVIGDGDSAFGLTVTTAEDVTHVAEADIAEGSLEGSPLVWGVLAGPIVVLRGQAILADPRLFVTKKSV